MLNFLGLGKNTININKDNIIKEGTLLKESRILKNWKSWTVLTDTNILTFEKERNYSNPTEVIDIINIKTVKSDDNPMSFKFKVEVYDREFLFEAASFDEKESWIGSIAKVMVHGSKKNVFVDDS